MDDDNLLANLNDTIFWNLITEASEDFEVFKGKLESLSRDELIGFAWKFEYLAGLLYDEKYHQNQYSEDYLEDLTCWIVAKGRKFYENVLSHPDQMPAEVNFDEPGLDVHFQALKVYADRFGEEMPAFDGG